MYQAHMVWEGIKSFCILRLGKGQPQLAPAMHLFRYTKIPLTNIQQELPCRELDFPPHVCRLSSNGLRRNAACVS